MRSGRRLGIDVGKARVGVAISDQTGLIATPFCTVLRQETMAATVAELLKQIEDYEFIEIYVGLPLNLSGRFTASTTDSLDFAEAIAAVASAPVRFIDERLTTVTAASNLRNAGRNAKNSRAVIDQEAATLILEQALNMERATSRTPGKSVEEVKNET